MRVVPEVANPEISKSRRRELSSPVLAAVAADQRSRLLVGSESEMDDNELVLAEWIVSSPDNPVCVELWGSVFKECSRCLQGIV